MTMKISQVLALLIFQYPMVRNPQPTFMLSLPL